MNGRTYWIALAATIAVSAIYVDKRGLRELYDSFEQSAHEVRLLEKELDRLKTEESGLRRRVEGLESDPVEMEAAIRQRKNLVRPGETVFRVTLTDEK